LNERGSGVAAPGDAAPAPVGRRAPGARTRTTALSLRVKLILLSAGLTLGIVGVLFTLLGVTVRTQTRRLLTATLAGHQHRLAEAQAEETRALLRLSSLMTESPTLRAALETYQSEWDSAGLLREDLLATIRHEVERLAAGLDRDLVMVTGTGGAVLAARETRDPRPEARPTWRVVPTDSWPCDTSADPAAPTPAGQSGILVLGGQHYLAACVPIVLGGDVIGSLLVGDRLDATFARRVHGLSGAEVVITTGRSVLASSREDLATVWPAGAHDAGVGAWRDAGGTDATDPAAAAGAEGGRLIRLGGEEYVSVAVPLSPARGGPEATLHLMHSLTGAVGTADRDLRRALFVCGGLALILAVAAASTVARSILRPLDRFVAFLREVAASGDRARRAPDPGTSPEMTTLARTYDEMMSSLEEHEQNLLKRAREDLERIERLQESEKLAALGRMLSGAAHEINNPLAGVLGNIDLLLGDPAIPEAVRRRLETTSREGRRIVGLVRNLLKTVHRDDGRRAPVDVNQVVRECCDLRRHDFRATGVALEQQLSDEASTVLGSEIELQQVALNIINNALDALQEGAGPGRRLTVRTGAGEGEVVVEFLDNGPGMQDPARVFDHFYTTKPVGKGTGLGLSIANAVVRGHGGTLTATNRPGGGACFTIRLPRAGRRAAAAPGGISGLAAAPPAPTGGGAAPAPGAGPVGDGPQAPRPLPARVLVVDDEPSVLELQITILEMHGATVAGARSGREAVEALGREPFDLVVSDLRMPGEITGRDLYHWAESHRPETARRFVFVTGDTLSDDAVDFIRATGRRCVQKPFSVEGYLDVLSEAFRDLPAAA
jgi:signal transduction histidine kinase/ActR/RegA family two-component response regulator